MCRQYSTRFASRWRGACLGAGSAGLAACAPGSSSRSRFLGVASPEWRSVLGSLLGHLRDPRTSASSRLRASRGAR